MMYKHAVTQEDEEQIQALTLGVIKCSSVLYPVPESTLDKLKKCVENGLRSSFLSCRIKTLEGIKTYLIECPDMMKVVTPSLSEYLTKHLSDTTLPSSKNTHHVLLMWEVSFLLVDKFVTDFADSDFSQKILSLALETVSIPPSESVLLVKKVVVLNLEKLIMNEVLAIKDADAVARTCLERLKSTSPSDESLSFSLLLTTFYVFGPSVGTEHKIEQNMQDNPEEEDMVEAMEKVAAMFDRLKVCCPYEAKVISTALPSFLVDFFPTQDVLNKVIGEFVSSQQLYPHFMADIVFSVFSMLHQSKADVIKEWVMLSLSSFPQLEPLALSGWSLTTFLVCASEDEWIKSL